MRDEETIEVVVRRLYPVAAERVFDAWLDPEGIGRWMFATPGGVMKRVELDPRVGGRFVVEEQRGETLAQHHGEYLVIERPRRLVFSFAVDPDEAPSTVAIELAAHPQGCELTLTHTMAAKWADYAGRTRDGWQGMLDGLARVVGDAIRHETLVFERTYAAPVARVFAAWADPAARVVWSVPEGAAIVFDATDFRPGGIDRARCGAPDDMRHVVETRYVSIAKARHIVFAETVSADGSPEAASVVTVAFDAIDDDSTRLGLTIQLTALTPEMVEGNAAGWSMVLDRLGRWLGGGSTAKG